MKKSIFIFAFLSLLFAFSACKNQNKTEQTTQETGEDARNENAFEAESDSYNMGSGKQKIEKLEVIEFRIKMEQLEVYNLIDVRTPEEFAQASILKAKNIDFNADSFEEELNKLDKEKPLFIYCKSGGRSEKAVEKAKEMGFNRIIELDGGFEAWKADKVTVSKCNLNATINSRN